MAAGVGKTYAMLEAARKQQSVGVDVVIGYVETTVAKTRMRCGGPSMIPRKTSDHRGMTLSEMDVDAVLSRKPKLALVMSLPIPTLPVHAIPNAIRTSSNFSTQALMSIPRSMFNTLKVAPKLWSRSRARPCIETVPDSVLDLADIELIDISPGRPDAAFGRRESLPA